MTVEQGRRADMDVKDRKPPRGADNGIASSTLARPEQLLTYTVPAPSISQLAAAYGFGLARNHCFRDGNKPIAHVVIDVFLQLNGFELMVREEDAVLTIRSLAAGQMGESELADWIHKNCVPLRQV
jgi:death-on-curing protein